MEICDHEHVFRGPIERTRRVRPDEARANRDFLFAELFMREALGLHHERSTTSSHAHRHVVRSPGNSLRSVHGRSARGLRDEFAGGITQADLLPRDARRLFPDLEKDRTPSGETRGNAMWRMRPLMRARKPASRATSRSPDAASSQAASSRIWLDRVCAARRRRDLWTS